MFTSTLVPVVIRSVSLPFIVGLPLGLSVYLMSGHTCTWCVRKAQVWMNVFPDLSFLLAPNTHRRKWFVSSVSKSEQNLDHVTRAVT